MNLEECVLKHVLRRSRVTQVSGQVSVKLSLVAMNELIEQNRTPLFPILVHQLFVSKLTELFRLFGAKGLNHAYVPLRPKVRTGKDHRLCSNTTARLE